jgi:hypothetical protein
MKKYAIPLVITTLLCSSCPQDSGNSGDPSRLVRAGIPLDLMGMVHAGSRPEAVQEYALLDGLGVQWMLTDFSWSCIQPKIDTWDLGYFDTYVDNGKAGGKKILALLDYDTDWLHEGKDPKPDGPLIATAEERALFCQYVTKTVEHYKGRVDAWCIWNEPNLQPRFWASSGTKEDFFALTKEAASAIRQAHPGAFIIGGAFNTLAGEDWVRGIFTSGAMDQVDAIAYHPYMPSPDPTANVFKNFKKTVSDYGFGDKIWITEVGYPTRGHYGTEVAEENMPETVMRTIVLLAAEGAERIFWYELFDHGDSGDPGNAEHWFGLVNGTMQNGEFQKRAGAAAYRLCAMNIPGSACLVPSIEGLPSYIRAYHFRGPAGNNTLVVWNEVSIRERDIRVDLPGSKQMAYSLATGEPRPIGESSTYTLKAKDGANHHIQFFTWETAGASRGPRILAP